MIDLQRARLSCKPGGAVLAFGGGGILNRGAQQSSSTATSTSNTDNRIAAEGSIVAGAGGYASSYTDASTGFFVSDSSNRSTATSNSGNTSFQVSDSRDSSNRSTTSNSGNTSITNTGTDATQVISLTSQLQAALGESQSDATRAIAAFGTDAIRQLGASVTNLYEQAGKNTTTSWGNTVATSEKLISSLLDTAKSTSDASQLTARAAISAYTPVESKQAEGMANALKYGSIAAAVLVAFYVFKKA